MGKSEHIAVLAGDPERLESSGRDRNTPQKVVWRAWIVPLAGEGLRAPAVAARMGTNILIMMRKLA